MEKKVLVLISIAFTCYSLNKCYAISNDKNESSPLFTNKFQNNLITISGVVKDKESGESLP